MARFFGIIQLVLFLGTLLPSLAVAVRRLHDIGRSGWWLLFGLIPIIGSFVLLVFAFTKGNERENEYGPAPTGVSQAPVEPVAETSTENPSE